MTTVHQGLQWLKDHSPIFGKMCLETEQRQASEAEYKKLRQVRPASPTASAQVHQLRYHQSV